MREYIVWVLKLITILVVVLFLPVVLAALVAGGGGASTASGKNVVAVLELKGVIENSKDILEKLHKQANDPKIKGIVLAIDSPGGAVGPSQDIYGEVKRLKTKKPIVVSMGSVAASGGLYSALAASKVYAQPGTLTGSIGVILQIPNYQKIAEKVGIDMVTIKSGKFKDVGNSFRQMTDEERAFLEETIKDVYTDFVTAVVEGRGIPREKVVTFADGRIILGSQAKELKLIDDFGSTYDAARAVFEILGTPLAEGEEPTLYYPEDPFSEVKHLLRGAAQFLPELGAHQMELQYILR